MESTLGTTVIQLDSSLDTSIVVGSAVNNESKVIDSSVVELESFLNTPEMVNRQSTPESTPCHSPRAHKPSSQFGIIQSPSTTPKRTPNSTEVANSPKDNQKNKIANGWVFSTPTSTPKKKGRKPDSKHNKSPSVTPQKSSDRSSDADSMAGTPTKLDGSVDSLDLETPMNRMSNVTGDSVKPSGPGPSPYKSHRPKYLPKNVKLFKKKFKERKEKLESLVKVDEDLLQATKSLTKESPKFDKRLDNNAISDPMGVVLPITHVFSPQSYFVTFDEFSLDVNAFVSPDSPFGSKSGTDIVDGLRNGSLLIKSPYEFRFCSHLLTVTSSRSVYDSILPLVQRHIGKDYNLGWLDLKALLINFGLTLSTNSSASNSSKTPPQKWNLEFLYLLIGNSFVFYKICQNKRLLCLLVDSLFEPILLDLHNTVILLVRRVAKHLLKMDVKVGDLVSLINRSYLSSIHNRFIFQYLAADPELVPLARNLGIRTICDIMNTPYSSGDLSSTHIMSLLNENFDFIVKLNVKYIFQLLLICEKLLLLSGFDHCHVAKLALFTKKISAIYSYFDRVHLNGIASRLEALASCSSL